MKESVKQNNIENSVNNPKTIETLKKILHEHEKEEHITKEKEHKKENVANNLKTTLNLISENPNKQIEDITSSIEEWIKCNNLEMEIIENSLADYNSCTSSNIDKLKKQHFAEKIHSYRESLLSILFHSDKNLKSLYYLLLNLFIWLFLWVMIDDYRNSGNIIDINFFRDTFRRPDLIMYFWSLIFIYTYMIVPFVQFINFSAKKSQKINYFLVFTIYLCYQIYLYFMVFYICMKTDFHYPSKFILSCETTRMSLKMHGYFREKILYGLKDFHLNYANFSPISRTINDKAELLNITIQNIFVETKRYLYYFFCPSLIYRDNYPRIRHYRWKLIAAHAFNFICCIMFYYILMRYICYPYFNFSKLKDYYSFSHFIFDSLRFGIPGVCFLVVGFFLLLHSWLNLWAEILRHGDRRFYEDWWNCTNFEEYYRTWNMVVHEWLYYYVYNDVLRLSLGKFNRLHAKMIVFGLSVVIHELILWLAFGFFFPILSILFGGPGIILTFFKFKDKKFNIMFWSKLMVGKGLIVAFYLREVNMRSIIDGELGLIEPWHDWIPRTILMYTNEYIALIQKSKFY